MSRVLPTRKDKGEASTGWIWRMMLGIGLIGLSIWGIGLCQGIFRTYVGPDLSPADASFAKLAAGAAWFVFFGPIAVAGLAMLWLTLRRLGALDRLEAWREEKAAPVYGLRSGGMLNVSGVFRGKENLHDRLECLGDERVAQVTQRADRVAMLLGFSAGTLLVVTGIFGLIFLSSHAVALAISSGISILAGLTVFQRTLSKENNSWLLPLRLFTHLVLKRHRLSADGHKNRPSGHVR